MESADKGSEKGKCPQGEIGAGWEGLRLAEKSVFFSGKDETKVQFNNPLRCGHHEMLRMAVYKIYKIVLYNMLMALLTSEI